MAKYADVAAVLFEDEAYRGTPGVRDVVLNSVDTAMAALKGYGLDLVVFSEGVESLGQTMDQAEEVSAPGTVLQRYIDFASAERCYVAGSVKLIEDGHVYNSMALVGPDGGVCGVYHKTNLTQGELDLGMTPGAGPVVIDTAIGRIGGIICFDLNFIEHRRRYAALKPDILVFPSMYHGGLAQTIWAYECRSFFVSALPFIGGGILDPYGRPLAMASCYTKVPRARINLDRVMVHLDLNREKFPEIERKYGHEVVIDVPANVGSALIYSTTGKRTAQDIVKEFDLLLLDDYFEKAAAASAAARA